MTVMADGNLVRLADSLWRAEIDLSPISPITDAQPGLGIEDAYAIQSYNIERRVGADRVIRGRKVGPGW
jgi:2-keto-4-pentenoate hydratase